MFTWYYLIPILLPVFLGVLLPFVAPDKKSLHQCVATALGLVLFSSLMAAWRCQGSLTLLTLGDLPLLALSTSPTTGGRPAIPSFICSPWPACRAFAGRAICSPSISFTR